MEAPDDSGKKWSKTKKLAQGCQGKLSVGELIRPIKYNRPTNCKLSKLKRLAN
ncbi:hypothetical protein ACH5RR_039323, partial [Cinchona calisaya]